MTKKQLKIYELYSGYSTMSINYLPTKQMWRVVAYSVKQAIYLAANGEWREDGKGIGIVEYSDRASDEKFICDDGEERWGGRYKHMERLKI